MREPSVYQRAFPPPSVPMLSVRQAVTVPQKEKAGTCRGLPVALQEPLTGSPALLWQGSQDQETSRPWNVRNNEVGPRSPNTFWKTCAPNRASPVCDSTAQGGPLMYGSPLLPSERVCDWTGPVDADILHGYHAVRTRLFLASLYGRLTRRVASVRTELLL